MAHYRVDRNLTGGYSVHESDIVTDVGIGAMSVAGTVIGASFRGMAGAVRNSRDRRMQKAADEIEAAVSANQHDRLFALAQDFVRRYPQQPFGYGALGMALTYKSQFDEAITTLQRAVKLGLDEVEASWMLATAHLAKGDLGNAIIGFTVLTQHSETRVDGYLLRAQTLIQIGDLDLALSDASTAISALPDDTGYELRGDIYRERGEMTKALDDYSRADRLHPNSPELLGKRAEVYEQLGKVQEASADRTAAQQASARPPEHKEAKEFLSYLHTHGVTLKVSANRRELEIGGTKLKRETMDTIRRLKPQLMEILAGA